MQIVIGVDPHKATNVVAAIDEQGELVGQESFPANRKGLRTLGRWAKRFPERRWAVEGAGGIGRPLAQKLLAAGERVADIPPKLSSRVLSSGNARKNDGPDATFNGAAKLLRRASPQHPARRVRRRLASELVGDVRALDRRIIAELDERIEAEVEASGTTLTEIFGVGPILAAKIVAMVGDVSRFPSKAHFASSEKAWRQLKLPAGRCSGTGSRLPATALSTFVMHMIAVCQARSDHMRGGVS